jgi:2-polyprenyl-3-methyl-5-hydroxy-6-metoxy-1,4-benzoquinol methylase
MCPGLTADICDVGCGTSKVGMKARGYSVTYVDIHVQVDVQLGGFDYG